MGGGPCKGVGCRDKFVRGGGVSLCVSVDVGYFFCTWVYLGAAGVFPRLSVSIDFVLIRNVLVQVKLVLGHLTFISTFHKKPQITHTFLVE